jgi:putative aldouronate transport system permease protein
MVTTQKPRKKRNHSLMQVSTPANIALHALFILLVIFCVGPVLLIIAVSFTPEIEITTKGYSFFPSEWTLYNYEFLFQQPEVVFRAYGVTIFVTLIGTTAATLIIALFAYPLSRRDYPYRTFFTFVMVIPMVFSGGLVPYYITMTNVLQFNNTIFALLFPLLFNSFWCIVMRTFYQQTVPEALIESARLDGAGEYQTFFRIVLPISLPGLATVALFMFVIYWNDYFQAMLFLTSDAAKTNLQTMQYLCYRAISQASFLREQASSLGLLTAEQLKSIPDEGYRMTIAVVTMGPILIIYPFFQRYFISGLTVGAVKG